MRNSSGQFVDQVSLPVSMLGAIPTKLPNDQTVHTVNTTGHSHNALSLDLRSAYGYIGMTNDRRLVYGSDFRFWPCRITAQTP